MQDFVNMQEKYVHFVCKIIMSTCMQDNYMYVNIKKSDFKIIEDLIKVRLQLSEAQLLWPCSILPV